jgi:hypothetical protein
MVLRTFLDRLSAARVLGLAVLGLMVTVSSAAASTTTITLDGTPITVSTTASGEKATATFTGTAGQRISLRAWGSSMHSPTLSIKKPGGTVIYGPKTVGINGVFVEPVTLPVNGTYSIVLDPPLTYHGSMNLAAWDVPADTTDVIATGASNTVSLGTPGQNGALTFTGSAGQKISMRETNLSAGSQYNITLKKPDGTALSPAVSLRGTAFQEPVTLPVAGTYTIAVNPTGYSTGAVTVDLWSVPADASGTLTLGGASAVVSIDTPGQNASYTFSGTAGTKVTLTASADTLQQTGGPLARDAVITIKKPDTTMLTSVTIKQPGGLVEPTLLPATGTYTVTVNPASDATGSITLAAFLSPADVSGTVTLGTPQTVTIGSAGQNAALTFTGVAGQRFALNLSNDSIASLKVTVTKPSNTGSLYTTVWTTVSTTGKFFEPIALPVSGTYTIKIDPVSLNTGSVDVGAYIVPADATTALTLGTPTTLTTTVPGSANVATFTATAGQRFSVVFDNVTASPLGLSGVNYTISNSAGVAITGATGGFGTAGKFISPFTLATAGTYKIKLDPTGANVGAVRVTVYLVPNDLSSTLTLGGAALTQTYSAPGQNGAITFTTTTAGQKVSFWFSNVTIGADPVFGATAKIVNASTNATVINSFYLPGGGFDLFKGPYTIAAAGTYKIVIDPQGLDTGSLTVNGYTVPADATAAITVAGGNATATTTVPGQLAAFTFSNTTARNGTTITYDASSACPAWISVVTASGTGTQPMSPSQYFMPGDSTIFDLPATGSATAYKVLVDPEVNCTGAAVVALS